MKLGALALDYDGTIATDGRLDPEVRAALGEARARGVAVVVATGRILDDLRRLNADLSWADALVAENGAVLALRGGFTRLLGREPPAALLRALEREAIRFRAGRCVVEADAGDAERMLRLVRSLELPLSLVFNRGRVMALPHGVCKSAGLRDALRTLRLSPHNALGVGDAENDHDLLEACEVGAAAEWGSPALHAVADDVVPGKGPAAVATYLRGAIENLRLPRPRRHRRSVVLGRGRDGRAVTLGVRGRNVLVAGDPRSGKSWVSGLVCEQLLVLGYSLCVVDPEGDYAPLEALPGVLLLRGVPRAHEVTRALGHPDLSVVVDLSGAPHGAKVEALRALLPALARFRRRTGLPHRIVVDEAHYFLDRADARAFVDLDAGGYSLVTHRVSDLHCDVADTLDAVIVTRTSDPRELATLARIAGSVEGPELAALLGALALEEAVLVRSARRDDSHVEWFRLAARLTSHVRHRAKYRDVPLPRERAFVFTRAGAPVGPPAETLGGFVAGVAHAPADALDAHARRGDFSRWMGDVFGDEPLAAELRALEARHRRGEGVDVRTALVEAVALRYDVSLSAAVGRR